MATYSTQADKAQRLVTDILQVSLEANPTYTHEEHLTWALGVLSATVMRKNHMDNRVFSELRYNLSKLTQNLQVK